MKIIDNYGTLIQPGTVPSGNLLWVDKVSGNNALAARGRMVCAFQTLSAAKLAAQAGDTIMVLPCTYNENNLAKASVNWHFFSGAVLEYTGTGAALFDTSQTGGSGAFRVSGQGVFKTTNASARVPALKITNASDDITLEFDRIETKGIGINATNGQLTAKGNIIKSTGTSAIALTGGPKHTLSILEIESTAGNGMQIGGLSAGDVRRIHAFKISSSAAYGLICESGATYVDAFEISSAANHAVYYDCYGNHPLHLRVNRIITTWANVAARALVIDLGSGAGSAAIRLYNTILLSAHLGPPAADYSIAPNPGAGTKEVMVMGTCYGRPTKHADITFVGVPNNNSSYYQSALAFT